TGVRKVATLKPSPEGITVCGDGRVFVAADDGGIWLVPMEGGAPERWATIANHQPAGISCDDQGRLFVAIYSVRSGGDAPAVMRIDGMNKPAVTLPAPPDRSSLVAYNGILAVPGIGVYASDSGSSRVVLYRETQPGTFTGAVVARDITLPNGIAYD